MTLAGYATSWALLPTTSWEVVRVVGFIVVAMLVATGAQARDVRGLWVRSVHLNEEIRTQPFEEHGVPDLVQWRRLDHLFRSHRTLAERPINPRLLRVLAQIQRHFGGRRIELLSGYRVPERTDHLSSYHQVGRAADFYVPGVSNRNLYDYCRQLADLGCGLYPKGSHVHVDVRSRACTWVDLSRYGEPAAYVRNASAWVARHPDAGRNQHHRRPRRGPRFPVTHSFVGLRRSPCSGLCLAPGGPASSASTLVALRVLGPCPPKMQKRALGSSARRHPGEQRDARRSTS